MAKQRDDLAEPLVIPRVKPLSRNASRAGCNHSESTSCFPMSLFLFNATGALKMRLDAKLMRLAEHNGSKPQDFLRKTGIWVSPSRIKYAQNQSSRGMTARSRIFNAQASAAST